MSNVKVIQKGLTRYTQIRAAVNGTSGMIEDERGEWVRYEDVQRLIIRGVFDMQRSLEKP